jgi:type I restriction enzyme S subunit
MTWQDVTLGDNADLLTGYPFKSAGYTDATDGIALIRGDNIVQGRLRWDGVKRWPKGEVDKFADYLLAENDVVLAMDRPWIEAGLKYATLTKHDLPALLVQRVSRLRGGHELDTRFLKYLIGSRAFTDHVFAVQTGTAVPHISASQIKSFVFLRPPIDQQQYIAEVLGSLDDKIELNRRMNDTLESMARRLFKSWFVDFDPVHAKAAARRRHPTWPNDRVSREALPNFDLKIAELFPDDFDESAIGRIPKDWRTATLENGIDELETGSRPKGGVKHITHGIPSIGAESIVSLGRFDFGKTKYVSREFFESMRKGHIHNRDVLLYKDGGRPGEYEPHVSMFGDGFPFAECCINEHVYRLRANEHLSQNYLYFWLTSGIALDEMRVKGTGVAIPGLNSTSVRSLMTLYPPQTLVNTFDAIVEPVVTALLSHCIESKSLADIRDRLLSPLLSGELLTTQLASKVVCSDE